MAPRKEKELGAARAPGHIRHYYTETMAEELLSRLAAGESLRSICRDEHMPSPSAVCEWASGVKKSGVSPDFIERYAKAREIGYQLIADELLDISDDGTNDYMERHGADSAGATGYFLNGENIARSRLRMDTRRWLLSKCLPRIYGDKIVQEHTGKDGGAIETTLRIERVIVDPSNTDR